MSLKLWYCSKRIDSPKIDFLSQILQACSIRKRSVIFIAKSSKFSVSQPKIRMKAYHNHIRSHAHQSVMGHMFTNFLLLQFCCKVSLQIPLAEPSTSNHNHENKNYTRLH